MTALLMTTAEIVELTGRQRGTEQLAELRRQGYWRAVANAAGRIVLPRAHFEAVNRGEDRQVAGQQQARPQVKMPERPAPRPRRAA
ncbi:MAG: hypothetical protein RL654_137 [Pseudomonadota bacterium]|jgi:hypothetical protein